MPSKIVLKINNLEALANAPEPPPEHTEVIYHWPRIISAALGGAAVAGAIGFGVLSWQSTEVPQTTPVDAVVALQADETLPPAEDVSTQVGEPLQNKETSIPSEAVSPDVSLSVAVENDVVVENELVAESEREVVAFNQNDVTQGEVTQDPVSQGPVSQGQVTEADVPEANHVGVMIPQPVAVDPSPSPSVVTTDEALPAALPAPAAGQVESTPADVAVFSSVFDRIQLTSDVIDREPQDHLEATLRMNDAGLLKVHLFTEVGGQAGQTFYHHWYRADQRMAKVRIPVGSAHSRVSSSKFIDRNMLGAWRVEVENERGEILARAQFQVE